MILQYCLLKKTGKELKERGTKTSRSQCPERF